MNGKIFTASIISSLVIVLILSLTLNKLQSNDARRLVASNNQIKGACQKIIAELKTGLFIKRDELPKEFFEFETKKLESLDAKLRLFNQ